MNRIQVKFQIAGSKHLIVRATIGGHSVRLIIDSAAGTSVIDTDQVDELELKIRRNSQRDDVKGIGTGNHRMHRLIVPSITFNGVDFPRPRFISIDLSHVKEVGGKRGLHGLLGSDFLKSHNAIIDYGNRTLSLESPEVEHA